MSENGTVRRAVQPCVTLCFVQVNPHRPAPVNTTTTALDVTLTWEEPSALCDKLALAVEQVFYVGNGQYDKIRLAQVEGVSPLRLELENVTIVDAPERFFAVAVSAGSYAAGGWDVYANDETAYHLDATLQLRELLPGDWEVAKSAREQPSQEAPTGPGRC